MPTSIVLGSCSRPCLGNCWDVVRQLAAEGKRKFRFKNKLVSIDATVIECLTLYDWAQFRRAKGAIKLHLLLDHDGYLPSFACISEGEMHEIRMARQMKFAPGTVVVFDGGYTDYAWFETTVSIQFRFVQPVEQISAFYGQDGQET